MLSTIFLKFKDWDMWRFSSFLYIIFHFSPKFLHLIKTFLTFQVVSGGLKLQDHYFPIKEMGVQLFENYWLGVKAGSWLAVWLETSMHAEDKRIKQSIIWCWIMLTTNHTKDKHKYWTHKVLTPSIDHLCSLGNRILVGTKIGSRDIFFERHVNILITWYQLSSTKLDTTEWLKINGA